MGALLLGWIAPMEITPLILSLRSTEDSLNLNLRSKCDGLVFPQHLSSPICKPFELSLQL
jgi:hypothetical protein